MYVHIIIVEILQFENRDLENIITPVNADAFEKLLIESGFDPGRIDKLITGFKEGFNLQYAGDRKLKRFAPNLKLNIGSQVDLWNKVMKEVEKGRYAGPFDEPPFEHFIQSPIGLVPKDQGKDTRLIFHLSYPRSGKSVNSETPKEKCKVKYPDFCDAIKMCMDILPEDILQVIFAGKSDMKSAFRNVPVRKQDFMLLIMMAVNPMTGKKVFFVDKCLPFGASISCALFQEFSDSVAHIFRFRTGNNTVNYLDDYFFVALLKAMLNDQISEFLHICEIIGFPVSLEKTEWASDVIVFLGFLIDMRRRLVSIPVDKVNRAEKLILEMLLRKSRKCTVHQMQKLCGFLNYLCRCIIPGRAFTRRLYSYTGGNMLPHHHFRITGEIRSDLTMWLEFLRNPTAYCRPFMDFTNLWTAVELDWYTDASKNTRLGFGGIFRGKWFYQRWTDNDTHGNFIVDKDPSIQFLELFAVAVSIVLWLDQVQNMRIKLFCDNDGVCKMINKGSSSCKNCMTLIRLITLESLKNNVRVYAKHVSTEDNNLADALSRIKLDKFERDIKLEGRKIEKNKEVMPSDIWPVRKIWKN